MADRRVRVLHCIYDDPANPWLGGGGAHRVFQLYRRLSDDVDATVLTGAYPGARDGEREGVRYEHVGLRRPYALSRLTYGRAATRRLRRGGYDVGVFDFSVYTPIRVPAGRPVGHVVHMPIGETARDRWGRLLGGLVAGRERRMLGRARAVQTTSEWMRARLEPILPPDARIDLVGSGVDDAFFAVERREADHVLFYGRLDYYQKGLDILLDAWAAILDGYAEGRGNAAQGSPPRLVIAGRGDGDRVRAEAASRGLEGVTVEAPVVRERVLELMAGARLMLMPSRFEGLPVVPMEAMAAGVPVVAAEVGGLAEIVRDEHDGLLVPPGDPEALAAAARSLLRADDRRAALSSAARSSAERFRWSAVAAEHRAWLEGLTGGGDSSAR